CQPAATPRSRPPAARASAHLAASCRGRPASAVAADGDDRLAGRQRRWYRPRDRAALCRLLAVDGGGRAWCAGQRGRRLRPSCARTKRRRRMSDPFALTEDQLAIQDMARRFTADNITPFAAEWDEEHVF